MEKPSVAEIRSNLRTQLTELESLESIYNPREIRVEDPSSLTDTWDFVEGRSDLIPQHLVYTIYLMVGELKFEVRVTLPYEYPDVVPEVFIRNDRLSRQRHIDLIKDLTDYMAGLVRGEEVVYTVATWLEENASRYVEVEEKVRGEKDGVEGKEKGEERLFRYWMYSHHIYSKTKRREIVDLANRMHIGGFCMPGKPGIICVEGSATDCSEYWQSIRSMTWKKIFVAVVEEDKDEKQEEEAFARFGKFEEVTFQNGGNKFNHMDMGELFKYLEELRLGYIFKELFGIEAKSRA